MNIIITQRIDKIESRNEYRDSIDQRLITWISSLGLKPITIPNALVNINNRFQKQPVLDSWLKDISIDGIILSGGNNIGEAPLRDLTEKYLLNIAIRDRIPLLGICRGMQMMGVFDGTKLVKVSNHVKETHSLVCNEEEDLPIRVNSYHEYSLHSCPKSYKVIAKSEDGVIEAISHKKLPWEGWMWHPERDATISEINNVRFMRLLQDE